MAIRKPPTPQPKKPAPESPAFDPRQVADLLNKRTAQRTEATGSSINNKLALGDAAAWPVQSFMKHYRHEFEYMVAHGGRSIVQEQGLVAA